MGIGVKEIIVIGILVAAIYFGKRVMRNAERNRRANSRRVKKS